MKKGFDDIATGKRIDILLQCVLFGIMIFAVRSDIGLFGLYIMAAGQILSSIIWVFALSGDTPRLMYGNIIRGFILFTGLLLFLILVIDDKAFLQVSCYMLLIGPVLGVSYFIISFCEVSFYSKVRKPYYLL